MQDYFLNLVALLAIYSLLAQGLNIAFGLGGFLNLAQIAAYAVGAYTTAILSVNYGYSWYSCLLLSGLGAACFSVFISGVSLKLVDDSFAVGTLALNAMVVALVTNWRSLTNGVLGIPGIPRPIMFGQSLDSNLHITIFILAIVALLQFCLWMVWRGAFARALRGQAEFSAGAMTLGVDVNMQRSIAFVLSSVAAGIAGVLYAYYISFIDPSSFNLSELTLILAMVVVGRPGSWWGCLFGVAVMLLVPEALRFVELPSGVLGPLRQMIFAGVLLVVVFVNRATLFVPMRRI